MPHIYVIISLYYYIVTAVFKLQRGMANLYQGVFSNSVHTHESVIPNIPHTREHVAGTIFE